MVGANNFALVQEILSLRCDFFYFALLLAPLTNALTRKSASETVPTRQLGPNTGLQGNTGTRKSKAININNKSNVEVEMK